jgi:ureidoglycolate hydrolase
MDENLLEIHSYEGPGYQPQVDYGAWRVAIQNYREAPEAIVSVERHNETDEIFVLTRGQGVLFVGDGATHPERLFPQPMELGKIYNVKRAVWHTTIMSLDASMLIVENRDTGEKNSDDSEIKPEHIALILETARRELSHGSSQ